MKVSYMTINMVASLWLVFPPSFVSSGGCVVDDDELAKESEDMRENVKRKFLVQMPDDFYQFWELCKSLNPSNPTGLLCTYT